MSAPISLIAAVDDPRLLGATVKLWPRQRGLLASLGSLASLFVWAIGRQAGKSTLAALAAVHNACLRPDLDEVLPRGRTRYILVACPRLDQASEFIRLCAAIVDASPLLRMTAEVKANRIDFRLARVGPKGERWSAHTAILALPANARSVRGMSASMVIADEFAHFQTTDGPSDDARMLEALQPSTRAFGDLAKTLLLSTPSGRSNRFFELFQSAQSGALPSARAEHAPTWEVVPDMDQAWLDARRMEMGEDSFAQEYGASFVEGVGAFFDLRGLHFADGPARPADARRWVAGLDPAFHGDRFGVALVGESATEPGLLVTGRLEGLVPGAAAKSLEGRRAREDRTLAAVAEILEPYAPTIVTDQHASDAVRSYFGRLGRYVKVVNLTGPIQTAAFVSTRARLLDGSLLLWEHPDTLEELRRVRALDTEKIQLPRFAGSHCDIASALALAVYELRGVGRGSGGPARSGVGGSIALAAIHEGNGEGGGVSYTNADEYEIKARAASKRRNSTGGARRVWSPSDV